MGEVGGVIKLLILLVCTSCLWAMLTAQRDEERWRYATYSAFMVVFSICIWHKLR